MAKLKPIIGYLQSTFSKGSYPAQGFTSYTFHPRVKLVRFHRHHGESVLEETYETLQEPGWIEKHLNFNQVEELTKFQNALEKAIKSMKLDISKLQNQREYIEHAPFEIDPELQWKNFRQSGAWEKLDPNNLSQENSENEN